MPAGGDGLEGEAFACEGGRICVVGSFVSMSGKWMGLDEWMVGLMDVSVGKETWTKECPILSWGGGKERRGVMT